MPIISRRRFLAGSSLVASSLSLPFVAPITFARSGMRFDEYRQHDATALASMVANREVTPAELLELAISRTEQVNPDINAVVLKHYELARKQVAEAVPHGPFGGVPFLLKDLGVSMAGTVTTNGSRMFRDAQASQDDLYMQKVREAGLVVFGKTHSPEFGNCPNTESTLWGQTHNPWQLDRSVGGSSGGAAAAIASGIVPAAHASDGGGSIRLPASACGLFGLKPSRGLVPMGFDHSDKRGGLAAQHVITRSVRDSAALLDCLARRDPGEGFAAQADEGRYFEQLARKPGQLRIAFQLAPLQGGQLEPECLAAVQQAAALCVELGHIVEEVMPQIDLQAASHASGVMSVVSLRQNVTAREQALGRSVTEADLEPVDWQMLAWGRQVSTEDYEKGVLALRQAGQQMAKFMSDYDLVLSPTMPHLPPKLGTLTMNMPLAEFGPLAGRMSSLTSVYNITGQPAMSVPLHWSEGGLPVGVMFAGRFGEERTLLRLAAQLEQAQPWFGRVPSLA